MKKGVLWGIIATATVVVFVVIYFLYGYLSDNYKPDNSNIGGASNTASEKQEASVPDFTVLDENGNEAKLSDYFGKPIVLNFWASWCGPCKMEMPHFEAAFKAYPDVQFLMVNATSNDYISDAKNYISESGYTFPVFFDTEGEAITNYGISAFPTTFFIDKNGDLANQKIGAMDEQTLNSYIETIK